jgi:ribosomal protein S18 acetylase RimI-like enzyme
MMNVRRSFVISTIISMFVLVTIATSMMVAGDDALRRLRRHHYQQQAAAAGEALDEAVYDQYLDLAKLVTDEHTLQLVEEREKTFGERKMIAVDDFEIMDHVRLYELFGMSVSSEVPTTTTSTDPPTAMSMSMPPTAATEKSSTTTIPFPIDGLM